MLPVARDQGFPLIQQISFFLPNKVGSLQRVVTALREQEVRICGLAVLDAHDHAVVRMVVDKPDKAIELLTAKGRAVCSTKLLGIALPEEDPDAISRLLGKLLRAEVNVYYAYALVVRHRGAAVLALHAEDIESAARMVAAAGFDLVEQHDLEQLGG